MGIWEFKKFLIAIVAIILLSSGIVGVSQFAFADKNDDDDEHDEHDKDTKGKKKNTTQIINLGYLQLAAHDFFDMNRVTETDNENGKLDLSTVLFDPKSGDCNFKKSYKEKDGCKLRDEGNIALGGEFRSRENIMILTAGVEVGEKFLSADEFIDNQ